MIQSIVTFNIDEMLLGLDIAHVREIVRHPEITPVHNTPGFVRGLMNLRGRIVTILDIGVRLGIEAREVTDESRVIVMKTCDEMRSQGIPMEMEDREEDSVLGFLVDGVSDIVASKEEDFESPPANMKEFCDRFIDKVMKNEDRLLLLLNTCAVCSP